MITGNVHTLVGRSLQELQDLQGPVLSCLKKGDQPDANSSRSPPPHTRCLIQQWDQLVLKDGVVRRQFKDKKGTARILRQNCILVLLEVTWEGRKQWHD